MGETNRLKQGTEIQSGRALVVLQVPARRPFHLLHLPWNAVKR